jgi:hypothetical protein
MPIGIVGYFLMTLILTLEPPEPVAARIVVASVGKSRRYELSNSTRLYLITGEP